MTTVSLHLYDLSMGMASSMSMGLLGKQIDYVPHTGLVVGGMEYFFGGGIQMLPPQQVVQAFGLSPIRVIPLGTTTKSTATFHAWINSVRSQYTQQTYDLFRHNCNNFSDAAAKFLLDGQGIPNEILDLPKVFLETPLGQMLAPMLSQQMDTMNASVAAAGGNFQSTNTSGSSSSGSTGATTTTTTTTTTATTTPSYVEPTTPVPGPAVTIKVMEVKGDTLDIHLPGITATVGSFRQRVATKLNVKDTPEDIRLIFMGKVLKDMNATVASYGIEDGNKVLIAKKKRSNNNKNTGGAQKISTFTSTPSTPSDTTTPTPTPTPTPAPTSTPASTDPLDVAIMKIRTATKSEALTCLKTLEKVCSNIKANPMDEKYRKMKVANASFQRRVSNVSGGLDMLKAIGFKEVTEGENAGSYVLTPSADLWNVLVSAQTKLAAAILAVENNTPVIGSGGGSGGGIGGGMGGIDLSGLASMAQGLDMNMLSSLAQQASGMNPQAMQAMMQNAMSNPQIMQQLGPMMNNPQMMQQIQGMMSNPQAMQQAMNMISQNPQMMQQMMGAMGGGGGGGTSNPFAQGMMGGGMGGGMPNVEPTEENVQQIVAMGIPAERAREALRATQNNVQAAIGRLFG
jgi:hypothetical protein